MPAITVSPVYHCGSLGLFARFHAGVAVLLVTEAEADVLEADRLVRVERLERDALFLASGVTQRSSLVERFDCEIDGKVGSNMRQAIAGFQKARGLQVTGTMDQATWNALEDRQPILGSYTITDADVQGPFGPVPESMGDKAKLTGFLVPWAASHKDPKIKETVNQFYGAETGPAGGDSR